MFHVKQFRRQKQMRSDGAANETWAEIWDGVLTALNDLIMLLESPHDDDDEDRSLRAAHRALDRVWMQSRLEKIAMETRKNGKR